VQRAASKLEPNSRRCHSYTFSTVLLLLLLLLLPLPFLHVLQCAVKQACFLSYQVYTLTF